MEEEKLSELGSLLVDSEQVPVAVQQCTALLTSLGIWHKVSRNLPARSCQDAARKRNRLGHKGIPLWDELKSFLGEAEDGLGNTVVFLAHCRGDQELDLNKVRLALHANNPVRRLTDPEAEVLGFAYGTVNPFLPASADIRQLFDQGLKIPLGPPGTVMTNAGDHTWAVEVEATDLVQRLSGTQWADITVPEKSGAEKVLWGVRHPKTIGILTGNPMDSGLDLAAAMNTHLRTLLGRNSLGDVSMPKVVMVSTPYIGISMEMDVRKEPLTRALTRGVEELCAAGAEIIAHPAHTTQHFAPEIATYAEESGARFLSMAEVISRKLRSLGIREIALLGTRYVTDFSLGWSIYTRAFEGIKVHVPSPQGWKKIHDLGYEVQQNGPTPVCFNWMRDLLREEVPKTCEHVVLAMTEFSPILRHLTLRGRQQKTLIDPLDFYGEALAREYLGLTPI